jgi:hypothetical protein
MRMRWESQRITFLAITGYDGEIRLKQRAAALVADQLHEFSARLLRRFEKSPPQQPATRFLRIAHFRQQYSDEGPQSQYVRQFDEVVTILIEMIDPIDALADLDALIASLLKRMEAKPEHFEFAAWDQPVSGDRARG